MQSGEAAAARRPSNRADAAAIVRMASTLLSCAADAPAGEHARAIRKYSLTSTSPSGVISSAAGEPGAAPGSPWICSRAARAAAPAWERPDMCSMSSTWNCAHSPSSISSKRCRSADSSQDTIWKTLVPPPPAACGGRRPSFPDFAA